MTAESMDPAAALSAFTLLFLAEMGDKTQLVAMTLAHRYRVRSVIGGVFLAFVVLNALAVLIGQALFDFVPRSVVLLTASALFLYFGYRAWLDAAKAEHDTAATRPGMRSAFAASFLLIFVAELGDKTQLALIALAAGSGEPWATFVGGTAALWSVSLLGIVLGSTLLRRVPGRWMHRAAALLFVLFGLLMLSQALLDGRSMNIADRSSPPPVCSQPVAPAGARS